MRTIILSAILSLAAVTANAQVPHTFTSGTQAKASEVNDNFSALDTRITANATAIMGLGSSGGVDMKVVDSLAQEVGTLVSLINAGEGFAIIPYNADQYLIRVSKTYADSVNGDVVEFNSSDCTGQGYVRRYAHVFDATAEILALNRGSGKVFMPTGDPTITMLTRNSFLSWNSSGGVFSEDCVVSASSINFPANSTVLVPVAVTFNLYTTTPPPYNLVAQ